MTITLSPQTETKLQELAALLGEEPEELFNALLLEKLQALRQEREDAE